LAVSLDNKSGRKELGSSKKPLLVDLAHRSMLLVVVLTSAYRVSNQTTGCRGSNHRGGRRDHRARLRVWLAPWRQDSASTGGGKWTAMGSDVYTVGRNPFRQRKRQRTREARGGGWRRRCRRMGAAWVLEMAASLMAAAALDGRQFSAARCGACPRRAGCTTALGTAT
jgi:hypothetical protein